MMKTHACLQNMNQNENKNKNKNINETLLLKNMTDINKIYLRRKSDIWHLAFDKIRNTILYEFIYLDY